MDELTTQDRLILQEQCIVIPYTLRPEIKKKVHAGYLGTNTCLRRERALIFYPNLSTKKICRSLCHLCNICRLTAEQQIVAAVLGRSFQQIDLLWWDGTQCLVRQFFKVDELTTATLEIVLCLKSPFAHHRIPDTLIFDNSLMFSSSMFKHFEMGNKTILPENRQRPMEQQEQQLRLLNAYGKKARYLERTIYKLAESLQFAKWWSKHQPSTKTLWEGKKINDSSDRIKGYSSYNDL